MNNHSLTAKQLRKRQKIIDVAIKLFVKHGIQGTSMQLLAKRADIATGSIYNYFSNKETLIQETFHFVTNEERDFLLVDYDEKLSVRERFDHLLRRSILYKVENPEKFRFRAQYAYTSDVMNDLPSSETFADHPFTHVGVTGVKEGLFKPLTLEELFYYTHGGIAGVLSWKLFNNDTLDEKDYQNIIQLTWDAIKAE